MDISTREGIGFTGDLMELGRFLRDWMEARGLASEPATAEQWERHR